MDKKTEFVSQITSFPPLSPETSDSGVTILLTKFFKFSRSSPAEVTDIRSNEKSFASDGGPQDQCEQSAAQEEEKKPPPDKAETSQYSEESVEGRRIQNGVARYSQTDHAKFWIKDDVSLECYECGSRFSAFRRRHHCRVCGQIFCTRCCSHRVPGHIYGCAEGLRVCTHCCKKVLGYLHASDGGETLTEDLKLLQENIKEKASKETDGPLESGFLQEVGRGGGGGMDGSEGRGLSDHMHSLQEVLHQLYKGLPLQNHRYRIVRYPNVWRGGDILQWLVERHFVSSSSQAVTLCQSLVSESLLECVTEHTTFTDYALYKPLLSTAHHKDSVGDTGAAMTGSTSSYCLDLNLVDNSARMVRGQTNDTRENTSNCEIKNVILEAGESEENRWCCPLVEAGGMEHIRLLLVQGLARAGLNLSWASILLPLCHQAANIVSLDVKSSEWDIRRCVRVKRVAGGSVRECRTLPGVVFSKNLAHRSMALRIANPRILLLNCSIDYQRSEGKRISLEPLMMQEQEHLHQCCARIFYLKPDLVLVSGAVSRLAQEELRAGGVALALGLRPVVLRRLARHCRAEMLTSIDAHIARSPPRLGTCKAFYLLNYDSKTLMVLEGFPNDLKSCSIILRGGSLEELGRVKRVISLVLLAAYNWRLESSLLGDMGATLPVSDTSLMFTDNSKDTTPNKPDDSDSVQDKFIQDSDNVFNCDDKQVNKETSVGDKEQEKKDEDGNEEDVGVKKEQKLTPASTDPLTSETFPQNFSGHHKKTDSKTLGITVDDFSDPLRARQLSGDDDVFLMSPEERLPPCEDNQGADTLRDRWSVDECVLSVSPQVRMVAPYLESEAGRRCPLRPYYRAPLFPPPPPRTPPHRKVSTHQTTQQYVKETHPFVSGALRQNIEDPSIKASLANFRAAGGRMNFDDLRAKPMAPSKGEGDTATKETEKGSLDPLDPENHQRMYQLYYSYSHRSNNAPNFCFLPSIVRMDIYGKNDIPLGLFLEKYCFNHLSPCTSQTCQVPLAHHVRKFVHGDGCVTVTCNVVESSTTRGLHQKMVSEDDGKQPVLWWCRCLWCQSGGGSGGGGACVRPPSLALSLAKYLELRFHTPRYTRVRSCQHSLNQHYAHYFAQNNITVCFKYSKIKSWDICLPPPSIATHHNTRSIRDGLINQINDLFLKGHEVFSSMGDSVGDIEKEQSSFKQHMDMVQLRLTSTSLQEQVNGAGVVRWLWGISDALVIGEKILQDAMEKWTTQTPYKAPFKITQDIVDGKIESDDISQPDFNAVDCAADKGIPNSSTELDHPNEEEEDKSDKRGLRAMLSQLLNSSQPAHQNGVVVCGGVVPLIVRGSEVSSLAAAALASHHYHLTLQTTPNSTISDQDEKENNSGTNKDKSDTDGKSKNSKNTEHIDVQLQVGLSCRVFFAKQFMKLRAMILCPLSSNPNITNDFLLKSNDTNEPESAVNREDNRKISDPLSAQQTDSVTACHRDSETESNVVQPMSESTTVSVESSPILSAKRHADDRAKRLTKDMGVKLEPVTDIEEGFIRSLSRCVPWAARGGKSGSTFCKTTDDRYILKEMSKLELQLFLELAPHYFNHIQSCHQNKLPTLLARIVGVYRVDGVDGVGGGVLVMENLWHGRDDLAQRFDLKGAQRNRLANQGPPDNVLLDENLLKLRWECPLYIQSHSAGVLWAAVQRDTTFLASHHVMDYSLLVGLGGQSQELVLGIIDYIRTFTWDKRLEHIVKKGLGSGLPTIVSPEQYKTRFCTAMRKYFLQSPNQWEDLHRGLVSDNN